MNEITLLREAGPGAPVLRPAARSAARAALLAEIDGPVRRRRRRPGRATALRIGAAVVAVAAAWAGAVALTGPGARPSSTAPDAMTLVAVEEVTFPLSLDPAPPGMTPSFTGAAGDPEAVAGYTAADGTGFSVYLSPTEPSWAADQFEASDITGRGITAVLGADATYVVGSSERVCTVADVCFEDHPFAQLVWERAPGQWVNLYGDGPYGDVAALVGVGGSLVDRPQPVNLQVGLAPAGWSVVDWHESSGVVGLASDADPSRTLTVQVFPPADGTWTPEERIASETAVGQVADVVVDGQAGKLALVAQVAPDGTEIRLRMLAWQLPDGSLATVYAPEDFAPDDVVAIANGVTYTP